MPLACQCRDYPPHKSKNGLSMGYAASSTANCLDMPRDAFLEFTGWKRLAPRAAALPVDLRGNFGDRQAIRVGGVEPWHVHELENGRPDLLPVKESAQPRPCGPGIEEPANVMASTSLAKISEIEFMVGHDYLVRDLATALAETTDGPEGSRVLLFQPHDLEGLNE